MLPSLPSVGLHTLVLAGIEVTDVPVPALLVWLLGLVILAARDIVIERIKSRRAVDVARIGSPRNDGHEAGPGSMKTCDNSDEDV